MTLLSAVCGSLFLAAIPARHVAYRSFQKEPAKTAEFARMGYGTRCFFAGNTLNSLGTPYCEYRPIWLGEGQYDFAAFDEQVADLVKANAEADFICIVDLNTPSWLARKFACDSFAEITHIGFDAEWRAITDRWMRDFLGYAECRYGSRIRAYLLSGGGTSEWYEFDRGRSSRAKNAAWRAWCQARGGDHGASVPDEAALAKAAFENAVYDPATELAKIDYWRFHNSIPADALVHFAAEARRELPKGKEIGVFFGYYHVREGIQVSFGHLDYLKVFDSPDVDFVVAPGIYADRGMGGGSGTQTVIGSIALRGKRFMHEIDFWPSTKVPPWLRKSPGHGYFLSAADDLAGNTREAAFALVNNASWWWFDMWGQFYEDHALLGRIAKIRAIERRFGAEVVPSAADILLVADPESLYYANEKDAKTRAFGQYFARMTAKSGFVTDVYSFADLAQLDLSRYRVVLLPAMLLVTPARAAFLHEKVCCGGRTVVWAYAPGLTDGRTLDADRVKEWAGVPFRTPDVSVIDRGSWRSVYAYDHTLYTPERLHGIFRAAGAHDYVGRPATVLANARMLAVHVKEGGRVTVRLPRRARRVTDLLTGKTVVENADRFVVELATPDTVLFEIEYP